MDTDGSCEGIGGVLSQMQDKGGGGGRSDSLWEQDGLCDTIVMLSALQMSPSVSSTILISKTWGLVTYPIYHGTS